MQVQSKRLPALFAWLILVAVVWHTRATEAQEAHAPPTGPAVAQAKHQAGNVKIERLSSLLPPIERALHAIKRRAAEDHTLKQLADSPIARVDYTNAEGNPKAYRRAIGAAIDDQIEVLTNGNPASIEVGGGVGIGVNVRGRSVQEVVLCGLYNGVVTWRTNNPHVFVQMGWCTKDSSAPDRLLAIVREELEREDLRLLPMHKLDWPAATTAERLSQLLPPGSLPPVTPPPEKKVASPQSPAKVFASPYDAVEAYNQAMAKKDWEESFRCLTPTSEFGIDKPIECAGIRIEGDKASGYWIDRRPAPAPEEVEKHGKTYYLPRYFPVRFRRIKGSWLIEWSGTT